MNRTVLFCLLALFSPFAGCLAPGSDGPSHAVEPYVGEVIDVPYKTTVPRFDQTISPGEWNDTTTIEGNFTIADGSKAEGIYNFTAKLGYTEEWFYILFILPNIGENPYTNEDVVPRYWVPDNLSIFLASGHSGLLSIPSDIKFFSNARQHGSTTDDGYWNGGDWVVQDEKCGEYGATWDGDMEHPETGVWGRGGYFNKTIFWEIGIPTKPCQPRYDEVDFTSIKEFRMSFLVDRQIHFEYDEPSPDARGLFFSPHDVFPGDGYTPNGHYDPERWLRLRLAT